MKWPCFSSKRDVHTGEAKIMLYRQSTADSTAGLLVPTELITKKNYPLGPQDGNL